MQQRPNQREIVNISKLKRRDEVSNWGRRRNHWILGEKSGRRELQIILQNCSNELGMILMENVFGETKHWDDPWLGKLPLRQKEPTPHIAGYCGEDTTQKRPEVFVSVFYFCLSLPLSLITWRGYNKKGNYLPKGKNITQSIQSAAIQKLNLQCQLTKHKHKH